MNPLIRFDKTVCFLLLVFLAACAPQPLFKEPAEYIRTRETFSTSNIEPAASKSFSRAEKAFRAKDYVRAAKLYRRIRRQFPKGKAHMLASYRLGTLYYYQDQYKTAVKEFELFLDRYPRSDLAFDVTYNLAAANFQLRKYHEAYRLLSELRTAEIQLQGARRTEMVYQLKARAAELSDNMGGAISAYASQIQLRGTENKHGALHAKIDDLLRQTLNRTDLEAIREGIREPITRAKVLKRIAALPPQSVKAVPVEVEEYASFESELDTGAAPASMGAGTEAERSHIGVVLPLTGRWANFGNRALDAILLGARVYDNKSSSKLSLFIEDTGSNYINAQNAVDKLFYKNKVIAIIGPINWREALAVANRSQKLGVVNLSLTFKDGISPRGSYLFQNALTPRVQLESLVRYCMEERKLRRFAILAPNDSFGKDMTEHFWDLVEKRGGKIVGYQNYPPNETDFQAPVRRLVGLANERYRALEVTKLNEFLEEEKARGVRNPKAKLPPILDFDAIFIPDKLKNLSYIAPTLAYFDATGQPLLGTTEWNNPNFYKRSHKYVEGAIFPGGIQLSTTNEKQKKFIKLYTDAYGKVPELLAAQAYEAIEIIAAAASRTSSNNRNELVYQLHGLKAFETPLGKITFGEKRLAERELPIYTVEYGGSLKEH